MPIVQYQGTGPILLKYISSASLCPRYSPASGHCTFSTDARAEDKVLLASPSAAKVVTFITHIASCIQSSMLCITRLLAPLLMQRHSLGHSIEIDS